MHKSLFRYRNAKLIGLLVADFTIVVLAATVGAWLLGLPNGRFEMIPFIIITTLIFIGTATFFGQYRNLWRYASAVEFTNLLIAVSIASVFTFIAMSLTGIMTLQFTTFAVLMIGACMFLLRAGLRFIRREAKSVHKIETLKKRTIIIGAGEAANSLIREVKQNPHSIYEIVGTVDDDDAKQKQKIMGVPVLGTIAELAEVIEVTEAEKLILAIPSLSESKRKEIIQAVKQLDIQLKVLPRLDQMLSAKADLKQVRDVQLEELLGREMIQLDNDHLSAFIQGETVLVSGAGGSIGSELCRQIAKYEPKQLIMVDIYENSLYEIQNELKRMYPNLTLQALIGSIRDIKRLDYIFATNRPTLVFHAAAHKHVPLMETSPKEAVKNNIFGTFNMATCAHNYGVKRFVMISTDKAVNPTNVMGATKRACEMIVQAMDKESQTEFASVRFGNVLGSNGSVIPLFKKQIAAGGPVTLTHQDITRYFMLIPEAVQLVLQAGSTAKGGENFVLDMGEPVRIYDLARDLIKLSGFKPGKDMKIEVTGLRPGEKLYEELLMDEEGLQATSNNKIFVGKALFNDFETLTAQLMALKQTLKTGSSEDVKEQLKTIVPTFIEADYDQSLYAKEQ
ncbi:MAG: polysaccharide biosynthesis protein [Culicoidibacterales bacterium]